MRLTPNCLIKIGGPDGWWPKYPLIFGFGKGFWGPRKMKYTFIKDFKLHLKHDGNLVVKRTPAEDFLPPGVVVYDALDVAREDFQTFKSHGEHPWPFTKQGIRGSKEDPRYKQKAAFIYSRHQTLYEGMKGAMNFTNSVLEDGLPAPHQNWEEVDVTPDVLHLLERRLKYSMSGDAVLIPLPKIKEFPKLNLTPRRQAGIHPYRKDLSVLKTLHEVSELYISSKYGILDRRRIDAPHAVVPFERRGRLCILNLKTDTITTSNPKRNQSFKSDEALPQIPSNVLPLFSPNPLLTVERPLENIEPVDWRINFEESNFYPEDFGVGIPSDVSIHTIFISNNNTNPKPQLDRMVQARGLLYSYGLAVNQARHSYGDPNDYTHAKNYKELPDSIPIQLVYYNHTKQNLGFLSFQLNTLSFNSDIKNQVWSDGPYDINTEQEKILKKMIKFQMTGCQ